MISRRTTLSSAIAAVVGLSVAQIATPVAADLVEINWAGLMTFVNSSGVPLRTDTDGLAPYYGYRTVITGTLSFDRHAGLGSASIAPFSFADSGAVTVSPISMQAVGDGFGGTGPLILGNMGFKWSGNTGVPVSIVWDAAGLFQAQDQGVSVSQIITGGALPATDGYVFGGGPAGTYTLPIGPAPLATTTWNTTNIGSPTWGSNPSGTLPLTDDGVGGSPMQAAQPLTGFNFNFDMTTLHVASVSAVPVPATVWLFGSGLVGLLGVARRRKRA